MLPPSHLNISPFFVENKRPSYVTLTAAANPDFNIGVGAHSPAVLLPQSSVSYPVTVTSSNGQTGYVNLSLNPSGLPAAVSSSFRRRRSI